MKLKALKNHYYDGELRGVGTVYFADKVHSERAVRNGLCDEVKVPVKREKKERKPRRKKQERK